MYSVEDRRAERYREAVDECYAFKNEFPESKYTKEADRIFKESQKMLATCCRTGTVPPKWALAMSLWLP